MIPELVKVSKDKRSLQIFYKNDLVLLLPSYYLRLNSPSASNKTDFKNQATQKFRDTLIKNVKSVGNYALRIVFSDGHDTGIYSWVFLHEIGIKFQNSLDP